MTGNPVAKREFQISGTGSQTKVFLFHGRFVAPAAPANGGGTWDAGGKQTSHNGRVHWIFVREDAGGGATAMDFKIVDRDYDLKQVIDGAVTYANIPDDFRIAEGTAVLTADAVNGSLDEVVPNTPIFERSLALVVNVTAGAAWTIRGYLAVEF